MKRFLRSSDPQVLCVKGEWGVGKTHLCDQLLNEAIKESALAFNRYSYVSLFGINTLENLKTSIAASTLFVDLPKLHKKSVSDIYKPILNWITKKSRFREVARQIPTAGQFLSAYEQFLFANVSSQLIIIDDLERKNKKIPILDILGIINYLKTERRCSVIIIFNDSAIGKEKEDLEINSERVIDINITMSPSLSEAISIAFPEPREVELRIEENARILNISNIRTLRTIQRFAKKLQDLLKKFDESLLHQAIHSTSLFCFAKNEPDKCPSLDKIRLVNSADYFGISDQSEMKKDKKEILQFLRKYNFSSIDDLDKILIEMVDHGFVDEEKLLICAAEMHRQIGLRRRADEFRKAWEPYHKTFGDNEEELVEGLQKALTENMDAISPDRINALVQFFKLLGRNNQAREVIDAYAAGRTDDREFWDIRSSHGPFIEKIDPDLERAFDEKLATFRQNFDMAEALKNIYDNDSWSSEVIDQLGKNSANDFYELFKATKGDSLDAVVFAALNFGKFANPTDSMTNIYSNAVTALRKISNESKIDRLRVTRKYGVSPDQS